MLVLGWVTIRSKEKKKIPTRMGFEPTRAEPIGLAVQRLNHSATSSMQNWYKHLVGNQNSV